MNLKENSMEQIVAQLQSEPAYVQTGGAFQLLTLSTSPLAVVNGKFALVYTLGEKTDNNGKRYEAKKRAPRSANGATPAKPTTRR